MPERDLTELSISNPSAPEGAAIPGINLSRSSNGHCLSVSAVEGGPPILLRQEPWDGPGTHLNIQVAPGARADIILDAPRAKGGQAHQTLGVKLGEGSELSLVACYPDESEVQRENDFLLELGKESRLNFLVLDEGGRPHTHRVKVLSRGEASYSEVGSLYLLSGARESNFHTELSHGHKRGVSHQLAKGIVQDRARALFVGRVRIDPAAQEVESTQLSRGLMFSDECKIDTRPELEIYADNVKATHGATVGSLDSGQLFYLMSRGLSLAEAKHFLADAFVDELILKFKNVGVRSWLKQKVHRSFQGFASQLETYL